MFRMHVVAFVAAIAPVYALAAADSAQFDELFGDEAKTVAETAAKKDDVEFALKLLVAVERLKDDMTFQGVLCQKAYEFASRDPSGYVVAVAALDRFAVIYPDRKDLCDQTALTLFERQYKSARPIDRRQKAEPYVARLLVIGEREASTGNFDSALAHLRVASTVVGSGPQAPGIAARIRTFSDRQTTAKTLADLRDQLAAKPDDESIRGKLISAVIVEAGDTKEALRLIELSKDDGLKATIVAACRPVDELSEDETAAVAEWWTTHVTTATAEGKDRATKSATAAWRRFLVLHEKQDAARLKAELGLRRLGASLVNATVEAPPPKPTLTEPVTDEAAKGVADVLVIYNTHNWQYGERGARMCNVFLRLGTKSVWEQKDIEVAWDETANVETRLELGAVKYDTVRIEITKCEGASGGLAEVEVLRNGKNIAFRKPAMASVVYNPENRAVCIPQMINDGIKDEERDGGDGKGYWLLPDTKPGWIEILIGR
jgi:hypothetical protein